MGFPGGYKTIKLYTSRGYGINWFWGPPGMEHLWKTTGFFSPRCKCRMGEEAWRASMAGLEASPMDTSRYNWRMVGMNTLDLYVRFLDKSSKHIIPNGGETWWWNPWYKIKHHRQNKSKI